MGGVTAADTSMHMKLDDILNAEDPAAALRDSVIAAGGFWAEPNSTALFEIHFAGVAGVGIGAEEAAKAWLQAAKLAMDTAP